MVLAILDVYAPHGNPQHIVLEGNLDVHFFTSRITVRECWSLRELDVSLHNAQRSPQGVFEANETDWKPTTWLSFLTSGLHQGTLHYTNKAFMQLPPFGGLHVQGEQHTER